MILAIMLLPGEVWQAPANDFEASGFDPATQHVRETSAYVFDPFVVLENGTWEPCPCEPGSHLAIVGQNLAMHSARDPDGALELAGTSVMVDGNPTKVYLVSPSQVNFFLPPTTGPTAAITLISQGKERVQQIIGVQSANTAEERSVVDATPDRLLLTSTLGAEPAVHLLTTPLSFKAAFDVTILEQNGSGRPLQAMVWNPRNFGRAAAVFEPSPTREVIVEVAENRGNLVRRLPLGQYRLGEPYRIEMELHRSQELTISLSALRSPDRDAAEDALTPQLLGTVTLTSDEAPGLFAAYRPTLTVLSSGKDGFNAAILTNYRLELPHERFTTIRAGDKKAAPLVASLLVLGLITYAYPAARFLPRAPSAIRRSCRRIALGMRRFAREQAQRPGRTAAALALSVGFLAANAYLFRLGSHPFDMTSQKIWAYVTTSYGITDLYYASQVSTLANVWNGMPFHEAVFPYGPAMAYYFGAIGYLHQLLFGSASPDSTSLAVMIKSFNLSVALLDGVLIYLLARAYGARRPMAWSAVGLLLLNPAVIFDISIWGETEPVPLFFLLGSLLAARRGAPATAWMLLGLGALTKQTVLVAIVVLAIYYLRSFDWRANLRGFSAAVLAVAAAGLPFVLNGYPPSIVVDPALASLWIHGSSGAERVFQVVSLDAFNLWALVTPFEGVNGLNRLQYPEYAHLPGDFITYRTAGTVLFGLSLLAIVDWLLFSRRAIKDQQAIFLVLAFVLLAQFVLPTGSIARYYLFATVLAIGAASGRLTLPCLYVVGVLSLTSLVGMMGSVSGALEQFPELAPSLAPENNVVMDYGLRLYRSDVAITAGALLNVSALAVLAGMLILPQQPQEARTPTEAPLARQAMYIQ
jgi:hypothetical protein